MKQSRKHDLRLMQPHTQPHILRENDQEKIKKKKKKGKIL